MENQPESKLEHRPKKFNQQHWEEALAAVFAKAATDRAYRHLCLTNPRAAVHALAPDLALPPDFKVIFVEKSEDLVHTYRLPTLLTTPPLYNVEELQQYGQEVYDAIANNWTGGGTPHGTDPGGGKGGGGEGGGDGHGGGDGKGGGSNG